MATVEVAKPTESATLIVEKSVAELHVADKLEPSPAFTAPQETKHEESKEATKPSDGLAKIGQAPPEKHSKPQGHRDDESSDSESESETEHKASQIKEKAAKADNHHSLMAQLLSSGAAGASAGAASAAMSAAVSGLMNHKIQPPTTATSQTCGQKDIEKKEKVKEPTKADDHTKMGEHNHHHSHHHSKHEERSKTEEKPTHHSHHTHSQHEESKEKGDTSEHHSQHTHTNHDGHSKYESHSEPPTPNHIIIIVEVADLGMPVLLLLLVCLAFALDFFLVVVYGYV